MKKSTGRFAAILISLCMVTALLSPNVTFAADPDYVYVGGVALADSSYAITNAANGTVTTADANESNWNVKYKDGILTLKSATILKSTFTNYIPAAILAEDNLNIELVGTNYVADCYTENVENSYGVYVIGTLNISGTGTLTANGASADYGSYGICSIGDMTISGGTVNATAATAVHNSYGIICTGNLTISGGKVNATGTEAGSCSYGIHALDSITISSGAVSAKATSRNANATVAAMNQVPDFSQYTGCEALASTSADVEPTVRYEAAAHNSYKRIEILSYYLVWVGGVQITSRNDGGVTGDGITGTVSYNPAAKTLTLNNATITNVWADTFTSSAIFAYDDLNIVLVGTNTVTNYNSGNLVYAYALRVDGALHISGSGTITATAGVARGSSQGILARSLTISGGTVIAKSTSTAGTAMAMNKAPDLSQYAGCIAYASESADGSGAEEYNSDKHNSYKYMKIPGKLLYFVWVGGVQISSDNKDDVLGDGTVSYNTVTKTLTLNNAAITNTWSMFFYSFAISANNDLNLVLIGTNTVTNNDSDKKYTYAVSVDGALHISGDGTLNATAGTADNYSCGIYAGALTISGGTVHAVGGEARESYGMHSAGNLSISGGTVIAKSTSTAGTAMAMNKAPDLSQYADYIAYASERADGSGSGEYNSGKNNRYKYILIESTSGWPQAFSVTYANGIVTVCAPKSGTYRLIFASYTGKKLHSTSIVPITFALPGKLIYAAPADFNTSEATDAKILLWEFADRMKPLCMIKA